MLQIYSEGSLVPVEFKKTRRNVGVFSRAEKPKRVHTAFARFDFDDIRSQLREDRRSIGSGEHVIKTDDAHAIQRAVATAYAALTLSLSRSGRGSQPFKIGMLVVTFSPAVEHRHAAHSGPFAVDHEGHGRLLCAAETNMLHGCHKASAPHMLIVGKRHRGID